MKFDIHKKYRFSVTASADGYANAQMKYYRHLQNIDFSRAKQLLKYFGDSFFHDGIAERIVIRHHQVEMDIIREDDYEDLAGYRKKRSLPMIRKSDFMKHPIIYRCTFLGATQFAGDISSTNGSIRIVDTEIHDGPAAHTFRVLIATAKNKELSITCKSASVTILDQQRIAQYTNNKTKMPYCEQCKYKLLTMRIIGKVLKTRGRELSRA